MSDDYYTELQEVLDQLEARRYALGGIPDDDRLYLLLGKLHHFKTLGEEIVVDIDYALEGRKLRVSRSSSLNTDLSLAEIVRDVEAGLAASKRVTRKESERVVIWNGREYRLRVWHTPHEEPTFVVVAISEAS